MFHFLCLLAFSLGVFVPLGHFEGPSQLCWELKSGSQSRIYATLPQLSAMKTKPSDIYRNPNPAPECLNKMVKFEFRQLFANGFAKKKKRCQLSFVMFPLFEAADQGKNLESSLWSWISTISAAAECFRTFKILDFNGVENFCNLYIQPDIPQTVVRDLKSLHKYKHRKNCESCPHKLRVKLNLNVIFVCPVCPVCLFCL